MSVPNFETRDQAIVWLRQRGLNARRHSGWLGDAIAVSRPAPAAPRTSSPEDALILFPSSTGWTVGRSLPGRRGLGRDFASLCEAVAYVVDSLKGHRA